VDDFSDLTVIIPTLNEVENVPKLTSMLLKRYNGVWIIVSDDGSTDGTKAEVERLARVSKGRVKFLDRAHRSVHGLTASVLDAALLVNTKYIVVMDGDMQHPYDKVGEIARALEGNDLVIASRIKVKEWGIGRRVMSKCMSVFVYIVFRLRGRRTCSDMMTGFFGINAALFKSLIVKNRKSFVYDGYKVLLDTLRLVGPDASIKEVYYDTFHIRKHGKSKLGMNQIVNTLRSTLM